MQVLEKMNVFRVPVLGILESSGTLPLYERKARSVTPSEKISLRRRASIWGFGLVMLQIGFALCFGQGSVSERYFQLLNWDSFRYRDIADTGYRIPGPAITSADIHQGRANVVFFPGYPMLARGLGSTLGVSTDLGLLLVSQGFCWLFWTYLISFLRLKGVPDRIIGWSLLALVIHPAAFFLVCAYTEPVFLAGLMGLIYWIEKSETRPARGGAALAAGHAALMSFIRIVSFALVPYPAIRSGRITARAVLIGASATIGTIVFFVWCQFKFGDWALYFRLEEIGWANHRKWFAILDPMSYVPRFFFEHTVDSFNRASVTFTAVLFVLAWAFERSEGPLRKMPRARLSLYFSAFVLFYIPLTGKANANMDSMIRYTLPCFILLVLGFAELQAGRALQNKAPLFSGWKKALAILGGVFSLLVQAWFIHRFVRGKWVA